MLLSSVLQHFRPTLGKSVTETPASGSNTDKLIEFLIQKYDQKSAGEPAKNESASKKLLEFFINEKREKETHEKKMSLHKAQKEMLIKKYDRKTNGAQWIAEYESECLRADIKDEKLRVECLKGCLESELHDWYDACALKLKREEWAPWREAFVQAFGSRGWSDIRYAYGYKHMNGSLVIYANMKEKMLLEIDKDMPEIHRVFLSVYGLPKEVQEKLERKKMSVWSARSSVSQTVSIRSSAAGLWRRLTS